MNLAPERLNKYLFAFILQFFNDFLCFTGILLLSWLLFDIRSYLNMIRDKTRKARNAGDNFTIIDGPDGELLISISLDEVPEKIPRYYCFAKGRHSGSFFLKIGAAAFCLGHLVHSGLQLGKQVKSANFVSISTA
jgi:hypothetical protein